MEKFLFERAFDLWGPQNVNWAVLVFGFASFIGILRWICRHEQLFERHGLSEHWLTAILIYPASFLLISIGLTEWISDLSETLTGAYWSLPNLKRADWDIRKVSGERFDLGGLHFEVGQINDEDPNHDPTLELLVWGSDFNSSFGSKASPIVVDAIILKKDCGVSITASNSKILIVVLDDTQSNTRIGILFRNQPPISFGGLVVQSGCDKNIIEVQEPKLPDWIRQQLSSEFSIFHPLTPN
jgi:hypothetical protein